MLPRFSLCHPQFIPSAAGHWELDPRSRSRDGYCNPAEQKGKGSGGETQQSRAPNQTRTSLHPSLRRHGACCLPGEREAHPAPVGTGCPGSPGSPPSLRAVLGPASCVSAVCPSFLPPQEAGSSGGESRARCDASPCSRWKVKRKKSYFSA